MRVVLYESSSYGGCYDYSLYLLRAYKENPDVSNVVLILPSCSGYSGEGVKKMLLPDQIKSKNKFYRKFHFLLRNILNPFILFFYLLGQRETLVLFNDFEQLMAPLYAPFFKLFLKKHTFAVFLHDPDRDNYPPSQKISEFCMKSLMSFMKIGLYHDYLPNKPYYALKNTSFLSVPHGLYASVSEDEKMYTEIKQKKGDSFLFSIIGNIRKEKNYHLAIEALATIPTASLLIAGSPANSSVDTGELKRLAKQRDVEDRIFWIEKFFTNEELSAVIAVSDCVLLYYAATFTSQSGILNLVAPYKKRLIAASVPSSLYACCKRFNIGKLAEADNLEALTAAMQELVFEKNTKYDWENYLEYASWSNQVTRVVELLKTVQQ